MAYTETSLTIAAPDGVQIPALQVQPSSAALANVLLLHGITTDKHEFGGFFDIIATSLAESGIASLRIDFRGHGESAESSRRFSITSQVLDTIAASTWLAQESQSRVHLLACSFGAPPAIFTAALRASLIATASLVCPVLDYNATFLHPSTEWASSIFNERSIERAYADGTLPMNETFEIDVKLLLEMSLINPADSLRFVKCPTLIIHGEADSMVPVWITREHTSGLTNVEVQIVPGMDHGYYDDADETGESPASQRNLNFIIGKVRHHILGKDQWKA